jgi:hypothetical protein
MIEDAAAEFDRAMSDPRNLVASHRALNPGVGRRFREMSINRAVIVLTVAAWQSFVEDLAGEIIDELRPPDGDPGLPRYRVMRADTTFAIHHLSTPNAEKTRDLLLRAGFNPWPHWGWDGRWPMTSFEVRERMNQWLRVRHAIAHGDPELPPESMLPRTPSGTTTLTLDDAEACIRFFTRVVAQTTEAALAEFVA